MNTKLHSLHKKTSSKSIDTSLKESEVFYRHLAELSPEAVVVHSFGNIVYINKAGLAFINAKKIDDVLGKPIVQFVHPDSQKLIAQRVKEMLDEKVTAPIVEEKFVSFTGETLTAEVNAVPFLFQGQPAILVILHDITQRKIAEEKEKRQQASMAFAQRAGKLGTFEWDLVTGFSEGTKEFEALYGQEKGYVGGDLKRWSNFIHPDDRAFVEKETSRSIKEDEEFLVEFRVIWPNQSIHYLQTRAQIIRDEKGNAMKMIGVTIDITERKKLEQQKDDFLGIASHELKTPVTSLKAFGQVLQSRFIKVGDENAAKLLGKMDAQINKLTNLIDDLLDISKIEGGRLQFHDEYFAFDELVNEVTEEIQRTTQKHRLVKKGKSAKTIYGDRDRIGQVITNFLTNAIKYSPYADKISIETKFKHQSITLSVQDFGVGIPSENIAQVFERFYRVEGKNYETIPGMGLGLYISAEIIKRQGGKIWAESQMGKGSTFSFALPLKGEKTQQENRLVEDEIQHE